MKQAFLAILILVAHVASADIVEFRIANGTGTDGVWNTEETMVEVKIGDTLRVFNDDAATHILHTNGAPCGHGSEFKTGESWDCEIASVYDPAKNGPLYDHRGGANAEFWIKATK